MSQKFANIKKSFRARSTIVLFICIQHKGNESEKKNSIWSLQRFFFSFNLQSIKLNLIFQLLFFTVRIHTAKIQTVKKNFNLYERVFLPFETKFIWYSGMTAEEWEILFITVMFDENAFEREKKERFTWLPLMYSEYFFFCYFLLAVLSVSLNVWSYFEELETVEHERLIFAKYTL